METGRQTLTVCSMALRGRLRRLGEAVSRKEGSNPSSVFFTATIVVDNVAVLLSLLATDDRHAGGKQYCRE